MNTVLLRVVPAAAALLFMIAVFAFPLRSFTIMQWLEQGIGYVTFTFYINYALWVVLVASIWRWKLLAYYGALGSITFIYALYFRYIWSLIYEHPDAQNGIGGMFATGSLYIAALVIVAIALSSTMSRSIGQPRKGQKLFPVKNVSISLVVGLVFAIVVNQIGLIVVDKMTTPLERTQKYIQGLPEYDEAIWDANRVLTAVRKCAEMTNNSYEHCATYADIENELYEEIQFNKHNPLAPNNTRVYSDPSSNRHVMLVKYYYTGYRGGSKSGERVTGLRVYRKTAIKCSFRNKEGYIYIIGEGYVASEEGCSTSKSQSSGELVIHNNYTIIQ